LGFSIGIQSEITTQNGTG